MPRLVVELHGSTWAIDGMVLIEGIGSDATDDVVATRAAELAGLGDVKVEVRRPGRQSTVHVIRSK